MMNRIYGKEKTIDQFPTSYVIEKRYEISISALKRTIINFQSIQYGIDKIVDNPINVARKSSVLSPRHIVGSNVSLPSDSTSWTTFYEIFNVVCNWIPIKLWWHHFPGSVKTSMICLHMRLKNFLIGGLPLPIRFVINLTIWVIKYSNLEGPMSATVSIAPSGCQQDISHPTQFTPQKYRTGKLECSNFFAET